MSRPERLPAEERSHRRRHLVATLRLFARFGFDEGAGGHVTARDPEHPNRFWINPFGVNFAHVRVRDLLLVDEGGTVIGGSGRINPAGFAIHSRVHAARPDVVAAAHTHSMYGRAWSTLARPLAPITQDACAFYEDHEVYADFGGVVLEPEEAERIAERLGGAKAVILRNHGLLTVGGSVAEAAWWFIAMERACQTQMLAEGAGVPVPVPPDVARKTAAVMGTAAMARLNFRPLFADVVRDDPSLIDPAEDRR